MPREIVTKKDIENNPEKYRGYRPGREIISSRDVSGKGNDRFSWKKTLSWGFAGLAFGGASYLGANLDLTITPHIIDFLGNNASWYQDGLNFQMSISKGIISHAYEYISATTGLGLIIGAIKN